MAKPRRISSVIRTYVKLAVGTKGDIPCPCTGEWKFRKSAM